MSKWCDTCYITGKYKPCGESCPVFRRHFGELAHHVIKHEFGEIKPAERSRIMTELEKRAMDKVADLENKIKWLVRLVADLCIDLNYTDEEFVELLENCCFTDDDFRRYAGISLLED